MHRCKTWDEITSVPWPRPSGCPASRSRSRWFWMCFRSASHPDWPSVSTAQDLQWTCSADWPPAPPSRTSWRCDELSSVARTQTPPVRRHKSLPSMINTINALKILKPVERSVIESSFYKCSIKSCSKGAAPSEAEAKISGFKNKKKTIIDGTSVSKRKHVTLKETKHDVFSALRLWLASSSVFLLQ